MKLETSEYVGWVVYVVAVVIMWFTFYWTGYGVAYLINPALTIKFMSGAVVLGGGLVWLGIAGVWAFIVTIFHVLRYFVDDVGFWAWHKYETITEFFKQ